MPSDRKRAALGALAVLGLSGCATPGGLPPGQDNFGEAVRQTMTAQIIDPAPEYDTPFTETSGTQVAGAIERYRTGTVKQPAAQGISTIGRQSANSGGAPAASGN
jgi:hypothetical protein